MAADGITTYIGVKKDGPQIEGDKSFITQWMAKHPWTLPWLKPLLYALCCTVLVKYGPETFLNKGAYALTIMGAIPAAFLSGMTAYSNYQVNKKL